MTHKIINQRGPVELQDEQLKVEYPWIKEFHTHCAEGNLAEAIKVIDRIFVPENELSDLAVRTLREARAWDPAPGLLGLDEATMRARAIARNPDAIEEWACVCFLVDAHREKSKALFRATDPRLPRKVRATAQGIVWGSLYREINRQYPWLADAVAELEAQRTLGYTSMPIEFMYSMAEYLAVELPKRMAARRESVPGGNLGDVLAKFRGDV